MAKLYKPRKRKRKKTHGFLSRSRRRGGQRVLLRRRRKGRYRLAC